MVILPATSRLQRCLTCGNQGDAIIRQGNLAHTGGLYHGEALAAVP